MGLRFRAVRLHADTEVGAVAFSTRFTSPLTVIRGRNTIGKSLLVQSMLYGLGLEALYATRKGTLTRAMSREVKVPTDGDAERTVAVQESWIEVVVENSAGDSLTLRRVVKPSASIQHEADLVRVWAGDVFDLAADHRGDSDDYLVGRPGVAILDRGFHRFLADFLGWSLPLVPTYSGRQQPLYIQEMFGLAYVDQKRGWGGTVPQVPTTFQIIDPLRKAVEFVLSLDVLNASVERQSLTEQQRQITLEVERLRGRVDAVAAIHAGRLRTDEGDGSLAPFIEILADSEWVPLDGRIDQVRTARAERARADLARSVSETSMPTDTVAALEAELALAESDLRRSSATLSALNQDEQDIAVQLGALARRLAVLDDEYERYRQINALRDLGSLIAPHTIDDGDCPTCHQSLAAIESIEGNALPVAETLQALRMDRQTVRNMNDEANARAARVAALQAAWTEQVTAARQRVRAAKTDLVAAHGTPSASAIQAALQQEQELIRLLNLNAQAGMDLEALTRGLTELAQVTAALKKIDQQSQSSADKSKLDEWTQRLRQHLELFEFTSVTPAEVDLDKAMRPVVDGYDIAFQGSASDAIRMRWAYLLSLAATATAVNGAHPGMLILDEPAQQGVEIDSLIALLRLMATSSSSTQMFVTTSEPPALIEAWLADAEHDLIDLKDDLLLRPIIAAGDTSASTK